MKVSDLAEPPSPNGKDVVVPSTRAHWRQWLTDNPDRVEGVWVVHRKPKSELEGPLYGELVDESLCFGWIDSVSRRVDDNRVIQWFSPRRKGGLWSAINKKNVERLVAEGLMTERGQAAIDAAKADGSWSQFDDVDALIVPPDLEAALAGSRGAQEAYQQLSTSMKKQHLWAVYSAKRPETRASRIAGIIGGLSKN